MKGTYDMQNEVHQKVSQSAGGAEKMSAAREAAFCGLFVALMCIGARISIVIPIGTGVTVSLQILFALLAGFLLGPRAGFRSVLIYLVLGLIGLPVYAHGGGASYLLRPTYGFLIGFAAAAFLAGLFRSRMKRRTKTAYLIFGELAMLSYYACGLVYLYVMTNFLLPSANPVGLRTLAFVWFFSTVGPDLVIGAAASLLAFRLVPVFDRIRRG
jgi:biotin transport system substrate-specific component